MAARHSASAAAAAYVPTLSAPLPRSSSTRFLSRAVCAASSAAAAWKAATVGPGSDWNRALAGPVSAAGLETQAPCSMRVGGWVGGWVGGGGRVMVTRETR